MRIGFIAIGEGIGDNIALLKAMYECKQIYNAEVILFGSSVSESLCAHISYIDTIVHIGKLTKGLIDSQSIPFINQYHCDVIILAVPRTHNIKLLRHCNAKKVITQAKILSIVSLKFKSVFFRFYKNYRYISREEELCFLVRAINPKLYDSKVALLDYSEVRIQTPNKYKTHIAEFLENVCMNALIAPPLIGHNHSSNSEQKRDFILVNPFNVAARWNLSQNAYLRLILALSKLENVFIIIPTYKAVHTEFTKNLTAFITNENDNKPIPNLAIFQNNDDLLNLVALVEQMSLLIAPSTGTIHIASNLSIPTIGIYGEQDIYKWRTNDKRYVILEKPQYEISPQEEAQAIQEVLAMSATLLKQQLPSTKEQV